MNLFKFQVVCIMITFIACNSKKIESFDAMVFVEGGTFIMGTTAETIDSLLTHHGFPRGYIQSEFPPHEITIIPFYIDKYEVSNEDFKRFLDNNPEWQKDNIPDSLNNGKYLNHWNVNTFATGEDKYPIYNITWYAASAYCQWQNKRLPTEAEWEYAATNGGENIIYPWGDSIPDSTKSNYNNKFGKAIEIGSYPPNKLGVYDLAGNVWEYTIDEWSTDFYSKSSVDNPVNGQKHFIENDLLKIKSRRVIRGGSWGGADINLRTRFRDSHPADGAGNHVGCRCVKEVTTTNRVVGPAQH
jgi:formylglycine-generating enzyme required for sulfatase activity